MFTLELLQQEVIDDMSDQAGLEVRDDDVPLLLSLLLVKGDALKHAFLALVGRVHQFQDACEFAALDKFISLALQQHCVDVARKGKHHLFSRQQPSTAK